MIMNLLKSLFIGTLMGLLSAGCSLFGQGSEEQPHYHIIGKNDHKEIKARICQKYKS